MEEMRVHKNGWMPLGSILLGLLGFITSFLFIWMVLNRLLFFFGDQFFTRYSLLKWLYNDGGMFLFIPVNLLLGLVGMTLGIAGLDGVGRRRAAKAGIVLCALAIASGIPAMLTFFAILRGA